MTNKIIISTVDHKDQRYPTVGDWTFIDCDLYIKISDLGRPKFNSCIVIHEIIEAILCRHARITEQEVDEFDFHFEEARGEKDNSEPGDSPDAPYHEQHKVATEIEKIFAKALGVDWDEYSKRVNEL